VLASDSTRGKGQALLVTSRLRLLVVGISLVSAAAVAVTLTAAVAPHSLHKQTPPIAATYRALFRVKYSSALVPARVPAGGVALTTFGGPKHLATGAVAIYLWPAPKSLPSGTVTASQASEAALRIDNGASLKVTSAVLAKVTARAEVPVIGEGVNPRAVIDKLAWVVMVTSPEAVPGPNDCVTCTRHLVSHDVLVLDPMSGRLLYGYWA
jgi:hypothetical protein